MYPTQAVQLPMFLLALAGALAVTWSVGREVFAVLVIDRGSPASGVPSWLEGLLPLKGRWLRCLLLTPVALLVSGLVFSVCLFCFWIMLLLLFGLLSAFS